MGGMWIIRLLRSTRLSAWVLGILTFLYLMGLVIPQKGLLGGQGARAFRESSPVLYSFLDWLGLLEIYTSPITIIVLGIFFVNILVVFTRRSTSIMAQSRVRVPDSIPQGDMVEDVDVGVIDNERLTAKVRGLLGRCSMRSEGGRFIAVRNRYAPLGMALFHLSFFLLLIGGLMLFYTRGEGTVVITEGQDFKGTGWTTMRPPLLGKPPEAIFTLSDVRPQYEGDITVNMEVDLALYRTLRVGDFERHTISVNNPATRGSLSILVSEVGVSPLLKFRDKRQQVYEYAFVSLDVLTGKRDGIAIPYTSFGVEFEFFPDYVIRDGLETTRSPMLNNPVFHAYFYDGKRLMWEGNVKPGQTVDLGPLTMSMEELRYWANLLVVKEHGRIPLIIGLALGTIGLVWRFFFNRLEVRGVREGDMLRLAVSGGESKFRAMDILEMLSRELRENTETGGSDAGA